MSENLYAPPVAEVRDVPVASARTEFHVVGMTKFALLSVATFGLYQVVWFYMHWARFRRFHGVKLSPVARAVFSVFFTRSLADEIDDRLRRNATPYTWSPGAIATGYVVLTLIGYVAGRFPSDQVPLLDVLPFLLIAPITYLLAQIQRAANLACGQPEAESNRRLTWANWIWLVMGGVLWLLFLIGLSLPEA